MWAIYCKILKKELTENLVRHTPTLVVLVAGVRMAQAFRVPSRSTVVRFWHHGFAFLRVSKQWGEDLCMQKLLSIWNKWWPFRRPSGFLGRSALESIPFPQWTGISLLVCRQCAIWRPWRKRNDHGTAYCPVRFFLCTFFLLSFSSHLLSIPGFAGDIYTSIASKFEQGSALRGLWSVAWMEVWACIRATRKIQGRESYTRENAAYRTRAMPFSCDLSWSFNETSRFVRDAEVTV